VGLHAAVIEGCAAPINFGLPRGRENAWQMTFLGQHFEQLSTVSIGKPHNIVI
jgi:hypothetical protein